MTEPKKKGLIVRSTGSWYEIRSEEGKVYNGRLKGKFKLKGPQTSNPIAVGDWVIYEMEDEVHQTVLIVEILPRQNYLIRKSVHKTGQGQLLAANIDQAIFIMTYKMPKTSLGFLDRFLVTAEAFRIPVQIVFNKMDLLNEEEQDQVFEWAGLYQSLGYGILFTSIPKEQGIDEFKDMFQGKISLMSGHSGVGKSSLMNIVAPDLHIKTKEVSDFAQKGVHTTTYATMWELGENTYLIDSPGIKELGILEIEKEELAHYFPEMRELLGQCKFNNCMHLSEPGCVVREALEEGEIAESRYFSYLSMLENNDNRR
ncbi:ribosome small subunit-dependent GTPase A [Aquirufa aurantiipilula]|uniref:Small ribosomal subunit biogenesis GTPase RsgA n=1 Tax=Aquirufa aurantiipilula TaxID=2696561 RepID=A0ABT6BMJ6_9BACT|nr:ribosome small subunit-dependent GTPase A [Aquirufa aurantiipilula]MDF5691701.1 ribosome small subunit-dependent GTPase A [Aquirufa aurantiipilula]